MGASQEMTLQQYCEELPSHHLVNKQLDELRKSSDSIPGNDEESIIDTLNSLSVVLHEDNFQAGWWTKEEKSWVDDIKTNGPNKKLGVMLVATKLCLAHSEISEALEGVRKGLMDDHLKTRGMFEVEIADTFIRLFDVAGATGIDLGGAVIEKLAYNKVRQDHKKSSRDGAGGKTI